MGRHPYNFGQSSSGKQPLLVLAPGCHHLQIRTTKFTSFPHQIQDKRQQRLHTNTSDLLKITHHLVIKSQETEYGKNIQAARTRGTKERNKKRRAAIDEPTCGHCEEGEGEMRKTRETIEAIGGGREHGFLWTQRVVEQPANLGNHGVHRRSSGRANPKTGPVWFVRSFVLSFHH